MAQYEGSYPQSDRVQPARSEEVSGWVVGLTFFASTIMLILGTFHFIVGISAVIEDQFYAVRDGYDLKLDVSTWGWMQMGAGILVMISGVMLMTGLLWARIVAIILATLSAIGSFYSIPYYPVWSIIIIVVDFAVLWALIFHGREMSMTE
jgi:hypothetical protein